MTVLDGLLFPPAMLYAAVMKARNFAFDSGLLSQTKIEVPVISVGNLSTGGTGKTPIVSYLIESFLDRKIGCGVVSRGYGGEYHGCERVANDGSPETARLFGDEPSWLAMRHPTVPVFVCADRVQAAQTLIVNSPVRLILADDAFQHRRLFRDLDIVVIDATEPKWHDWPLPMGRRREGDPSLKRARFVFLTKTNLATPERLAELRDHLKTVSKEAGLRVVEFESRIAGFQLLADYLETQASLRDLDQKKVLLVSAIGRPETFPDLVRRSSNVTILDHLIYRDHFSFTERTVADINSIATRLGAEAVVTTEKDAAKLFGLSAKFSIPVYMSLLRIQPVNNQHGMESFFEAVDRLFI